MSVEDNITKINFIAEIGINHKGSEKIARELIDISYQNNCWGIKFQYRNKNSFYNKTNEIGDEMIADELDRSFISLDKIKVLTEYAKSLNLKVGISFFSLKDLDEIKKENINFDFYKIPSAEFSNLELVKDASTTGIQVMLSTGGHNLEQIKKNIVRYNFLNKPVYMLCTSNYPTEIGNQNLLVLDELKKINNINIGYSSHDINYEIPIIAAFKGAKFIERHITLDKQGDGLDDSTSSDTDELKKIMNILNNYENILGDKAKPINQGEKINIQNLGTSLYAIKDINQGSKVSILDFKIKAPRTGLSVNDFDNINNKILKNKIYKDDVLTESHFLKKLHISSSDYKFLNDKNVSLPIRFHDAEDIFENFDLINYEIHLSYKDMDDLEVMSNKNVFSDKKITIHLPDYLDKNTLFDPFSSNLNIKEKSNEFIQKTIDFYQNVSSLSENLLIVSSIGINSLRNKENYYEELKNLIDNLQKEEVVYSPQWLPKKAWYFGGSFNTEVMSTYEDIVQILEKDISICLDVAHLIMSANSSGEDWRKWFNLLIKNSNHVHISDSNGEDGEGVPFGEGELDNIEEILNHPTIKVLEVWQGHLNNYSGFFESLIYLAAQDV